MYQNQGQQKQKKPDAGIGYTRTPKNGGSDYVSLRINRALINTLPAVEGIEGDFVDVTMFSNLAEKKPGGKTPDYILKPKAIYGGANQGQKRSSYGSNAPASSTGKLPWT